MTRNYRSEYDNYHSKKKQKVRRAGRNKARRMMVREKGKSALNGKDIDPSIMKKYSQGFLKWSRTVK